MKLLGLIDEDFINYKVACMTVIFPKCSFKCNKEAGKEVCHNTYLKDADLIEISESELVERYMNNPISEALIMQGLEPFDSYDDMRALVQEFIEHSDDDIVIYTGYTEEEIGYRVKDLKELIHKNKLIIKFGRFLPDQESHIDPILKVKLASDNQYAKEF